MKADYLAAIITLVIAVVIGAAIWFVKTYPGQAGWIAYGVLWWGVLMILFYSIRQVIIEHRRKKNW